MRSFFLCLLAALWLAAGAAAQIRTVRGAIADAEGSPVPFATIVEKGTRNAVSADVNGHFAIRLPLPAKVVIAATGFISVEIRVNDTATFLSCILKTGERTLETVVVTTGLGVERDHEEGYTASSISGATLHRVAGLEVRVAGKPEAPRGFCRAGDPAETKSTCTATPAATGHQLTAGEVSDFKKWKLWGDYNESDFKVLSENWGLSFRKRYCVLVQNREHRALVNKPVLLIDTETGDTVWSAVTDHTGKAELWADAFTGNPNTLQLACCGIAQQAVPFAQGLNRVVADVPCPAARVVDVAFVVDATGSMADEIRYLQAELGAVIGESAAAHADLALRCGAVFYRDHGDAYLTRAQRLSADTNVVLGFIRKQEAGGGGDGPEAVEEALRTAFDSLVWSGEARSRVLFLVLDAPPHERDRERIAALAREAAQRGIRIVPVVCSGADKNTEYLMRCLALATNGTYTCLTDDSGIGGKHLKPTTDDFKVELLADLLKRLIGELCYTEDCSADGQPAPVQTVAASERLLVYPNPASDHVFVESARDVQEAYLADFTGKLLQRVSINRKGRCHIGLGNYPSGTYLLRYFIPEKGWGSEKIVLLR